MDQDAPLAACIAHYTFPFRSISQLPSAPPTSLAGFSRAASQLTLCALLFLPPAMEGVGVGEGGGPLQGVTPDCPNPFHRCAEYCPVPPPPVSAKAVMNGTAHRNSGQRVIAAAPASEEMSEVIDDSENVGERRRSGARTPARHEEAGTSGRRSTRTAPTPPTPSTAAPSTALSPFPSLKARPGCIHRRRR
jgi:hypothetical protein